MVGLPRYRNAECPSQQSPRGLADRRFEAKGVAGVNAGAHPQGGYKSGSLGFFVSESRFHGRLGSPQGEHHEWPWARTQPDRPGAYRYDAAGNVITDNTNCYTYDAESRITPVAAEQG